MTTRKARWAVPPEGPEGDPVITRETPKEVVRQIFARKLWRLTVAKGWNQSELARRAGIARDSVSTYVRGLALPDPVNAQRLANALGTTVKDMLPGAGQVGNEESVSAVELREAVGSPGRAWLRINKEVPFEVAVKILALLQEGED